MPDLFKAPRRRETVGAALVILALAAALCCVRLPEKPAVRLTGAAALRGAEVSPLPAQTGAVPINTARETELTAISGIGPALAAEIVSEREANGPFFYPEDLLMVKGIGEKKLAELAPVFDFTTEGICP